MSSVSTVQTSWLLPADCTSTIGNASAVLNATQLVVTCTDAGAHEFRVFTGGNPATMDTFYITLHKESCYRWYFVLYPNIETAGATLSTGTRHMPRNSVQTARIWIMQPDVASSDELSGYAATPSAVSKQLTESLYALGEEPRLRVTHRFSRIEILAVDFDAKGM